MLGNINVIDPEKFLKAFDGLGKGNKHVAGISFDYLELKQKEIKPLASYVEPASFPDCCEGHKGIFKMAVDWLAVFPNCCIAHKKLLNTHWFSKTEYAYLPLKLTKAIAYTWHCISENIEKIDWYDAIIEYIDYAYKSFGQLPNGFGSPIGVEMYLASVKGNVEVEKEILDFKKKEIIDFIEHYYKPIKPLTLSTETDLNILFDTYKRWLSLFPFDLKSYFGSIKEKLEHQMPILSGKPKENRYGGWAMINLVTKDQLIQHLVNLTNSLLTEINGLKLFEHGMITDVDKIKLELITSERTLKIKEGYANNSKKDETRFRKMLKEWFKDEKKFMEEISPLLRKTNSQPAKADFSEQYDLSYYTNEVNIPNQKLVKDTIEYFETGAGKRAFKPLAFLNLLEKQYRFVTANIRDIELLINHFKSLPLKDLEKHILYGFLIKWFGGYPIQDSSGFQDADFYYNFKKRLLEIFLAYPENTPEKELCKADSAERRKFMKYEIAFTNAIRTNTDARIHLAAMEEPQLPKTTFETFDDLFTMALMMQTVETPVNHAHQESIKCYHNFNFNVWLQEHRGLEYGNREQYQQLLTKENWKSYIHYEKRAELDRIEKHEKEKESWQSLEQNNEITTTEEFLSFFESIGEVIRPACIEFANDGTATVTAWNIGKSINELYDERTEEIEKIVSAFKKRCYDLKITQDELRSLSVKLKAAIRLFKDDNTLFKDNPDYQQQINVDFENAANRLEGFLNDVVLPKLQFQNAEKDEVIETDKPQLPIPTYALLHVYLSMFGGQAVTQQNKNELAKQYGYNSGNQLRNDFTLFQNEDKRLEINSSNRRSADTHLKRYEIILTLLESENTFAFEKAQKDYHYLKKEYSKYY